MLVEDITFAKVVSDTHGRDFILIGATLIGLDVDRRLNNEMVDQIVSALRRSGNQASSAVQAGRQMANPFNQAVA